MSKDWDLNLNDGVEGEVKRRANRGLWLSGEYVLGETLRVIPIEEGTLGRSGFVSSDESRNKVAVAFDSVYAVRQHEELDYRHDPGRKAKYLEDTLNNSHAEIKQIIAATIRGDL